MSFTYQIFFKNIVLSIKKNKMITLYTVCGIWSREQINILFKFCLPGAETKTAMQQQRKILPILPEVGTHTLTNTHTHNSFLFSLFFFFFYLPLHRIYLPCSNHRSIIIRAQRRRRRWYIIICFLPFTIPLLYFTCLVSMFVHVGSDFVFIAYYPDVGMYYALLLPDYRYFVYYLPSFLPSFLPSR